MDLEREKLAATQPGYVGFWKRLVASFIDTIIVIVVTAPLLYAVYGKAYFSEERSGFAGMTDALLQIILPPLFALLFWKFRGATPGKLLMAARIVDARTLGPPSNGQLIGRYFAYILSALPLGLGFVWAAFDKRKQAWHDKLAKTLVIEDDEA